MRYHYIILVCLAFFMLGQGIGIAQSQPVKYEQPPNMDTGCNYSSELKTNYIMADDWLCADGLPVTDIHWWGSYWTPLEPGGYIPYSDMRDNAPSGGINLFTIMILSDVPADDPNNQLGFSHPGDLLGLYYVQGDCNETYHGTVVKSTNPDGSPAVYEDVYEYSLDLTTPGLTPFLQEQGKIYWLSIVASLPDEARQWGWHESSIHWNDYAVQGVVGEVVDWYNPCGGVDMAFALTTVPEPGSLLALGSGMIGLVGFAIKKRRTR